MLNDKKEYYYIYKITCTAGSFKDHYYIGQHKTTDLDDGYKGSGVKIQKYYQKYPNDYVKEILCWCENEEDMNLKEDFYVGDLYKTDPLCLNLCSGGNHYILSEETRQKMSEVHKGRTFSEETRQKMSEVHKGKNNPMYGKTGDNHPMYGKGYKLLGEKNGMYGRTGNKHPNYGKHHTLETRQKQSESMKGKYTGDKNPNYGKHWYTNGTENIRSFECPYGFYAGKTLKKI